jgi:hypothetical protein
VAVPGNGHEDVGADEQNNGPHTQIVCKRRDLGRGISLTRSHAIRAK